MLNKQQIMSLAYFDGTTLDQIIEKGVSPEDLRKIAGQCGQWAYETATPSSRTAYLQRAEALVEIAEQRERLAFIGNLMQNPSKTAPVDSELVQDVYWNE